MSYSVYFDVAAVCVLITAWIAYTIQTRIKTIQNVVYRVMICAVFLMALADILLIENARYAVLKSPQFVYLLKNIYFLAYAAVAVSFAVYSISLAGRLKTPKKKSHYLLILPIVLIIALTAVQSFVRCIFYIDSEMAFHRLWGMNVIIICIVFYFIIGLLYLFRYYRKISRESIMASLALVFICIVTAVIQEIFPQILLIPFGLSMSVLLYLIAMEKPQDYLEPDTKLFNQRAFLKTAAERIATGEKFPVLVIKVHNVKVMNQALGAESVGALLQEIAAYLKRTYPKRVVYRFSQSVFILRLNRRDYVEEAPRIIKEIQERFNQPWQSQNIETKFNIHMAYIVCPQDADNLSTFIDYVQYVRASSSESKNIVLRVGDMNIEKHNREMKIRQMLEEAVDNDGFEVFYQPIYSLSEEKFVSAEALVRLKDQSIGYVSPEEFIGIAEQSGYITQIGEFVFEAVCRFIKEENPQRYGIRSIAVNLSIVQCFQNTLAEKFYEIMKKYDVNAENVRLEITESVAAHNNNIMQSIDVLHNGGIQFALDDFGSGYSNVEYLFKFPFYIVKIDKLMLWEALQNERAMITLRNTIRMIKELGLKVVVEGVETQESVDCLREQNCDYLQGYFFSKPIPKPRFMELVKAQI